MIKELTQQLSRGNNLTIDQMTSVMNEILGGTQNDQDVAEFLKNLTQKGESDDELLAMLNKMEETMMVRLQNFLEVYQKKEKQMKNYEQCLLK